MSHDVFISYASDDKPKADAICHGLESNGIRCWIAPRDVPPGQEWAESIIDAIESAEVLLLVHSGNAEDSEQVKREVERAVSSGKKIMPVRTEDTPLGKAFEFFISSIHWLDAITPPLEAHIDNLAVEVKALLTGAEVPDRRREAPKPPPVPWYRRKAVLGGGAATLGVIVVTILLTIKGDVTVPSVADLSEDQARQLLEREGLNVDVEMIAHDTITGGKAIRTEPGAGMVVKEEGTVTLYVSGMVTIPNVEGLLIEVAKERLEARGLSVEIEYVPDDAAAGTVLASTPGGGASVLQGQDVVVRVSEDKITVPNVVGMTEEDATSLIANANLEPQIQKIWSQGSQIGKVLKTVPVGESQARRDAPVEIHIASKGGWSFLDLDIMEVNQALPMPRGLKLRSRPTNGAEELGSVAAGTEVIIREIDASGRWAKIVVAN